VVLGVVNLNYVSKDQVQIMFFIFLMITILVNSPFKLSITSLNGYLFFIIIHYRGKEKILTFCSTEKNKITKFNYTSKLIYFA